MRVIEARRESLIEQYQKMADLGVAIYRVRVTESDITPETRWLLPALRQRHELGERVRIVSAADVAAFGANNPLPEIINLGTNCCYEVCWDDNGILTGAIRSDDPDQASRWRTFIQSLYEIGEDIDSFVDRSMDRIGI